MAIKAYQYSSLINTSGTTKNIQKTQVRMSSIGMDSDSAYPIGSFKSAGEVDKTYPYTQWVDYSDVESDSVPTGFYQYAGGKKRQVCSHLTYTAEPWTTATDTTRSEWQTVTEDASETFFFDSNRPVINASSIDDPGKRVSSSQINMSSLFSGDSLIFGPNLVGGVSDETEGFNMNGYDFYPTASGIYPESAVFRDNVFTYDSSTLGNDSVNNYNTVYNNASYFGWFAILNESGRSLHNEMILHLKADKSHYRHKTFIIDTTDPYDHSGDYDVSSVSIEYEWVFAQFFGNNSTSLMSTATYNTDSTEYGKLFITDYFRDYFTRETLSDLSSNNPSSSVLTDSFTVSKNSQNSVTVRLGYRDVNTKFYTNMPFKITAALGSNGDLVIDGQYIMFCYYGRLGLLMPRIRSIYRKATKTYKKLVTVTSTTTGVNTKASKNFSLTTADYYGMNLNDTIYSGKIIRNRSTVAVPGKLHFGLTTSSANYCYCVTPQTASTPTVFLCSNTYTNGWVDYYENLQPGSCVVGSSYPPGYDSLMTYYNVKKTSTDTKEKMWWWYDLNLPSSASVMSELSTSTALKCILNSSQIFSFPVTARYLHIYPGYYSGNKVYNTTGTDLTLDCNYVLNNDSATGSSPYFKNSNGTTCTSGKITWPSGGWIQIVVPSDNGSGSTSRTISCNGVLKNTYLKCDGQSDSTYTFPTYSWTEKYPVYTSIACNANYQVTHGWGCTFNNTSIAVSTSTSNSFGANYTNYDWGNFYKNITCSMSFTPDSINSYTDLRTRYYYSMNVLQNSSTIASSSSSYFVRGGSSMSMSCTGTFSSSKNIWIQAKLYSTTLNSPVLSGSITDAGSWRRYMKIRNNNPIALSLYYTSNKTKSTTSANSNWTNYGTISAYGTSSSLTIQDQSGYDDEWIIAGFYLGYYSPYSRYLCTTWDEDVGTSSSKSSNWWYSR